MKKEWGYFLVLVVLLIGFAEAKIDISDVNEVYNLGDKIYITVDVVPTSVMGRFEINLVCLNESENIERFNAEKSFTPGEPAKYSTWVELHPQYIGYLRGNCNIIVSLGSEQKPTNSFIITDEINGRANLTKTAYDPEEAITLSIDAIKANGHPLTGFVEVSGATQFTKTIERRKYSRLS